MNTDHEQLNILAPRTKKPKFDYLHREVQRAAGDQHFAITHQQPRFQADGALIGRHHREIELIIEHHFG